MIFLLLAFALASGAKMASAQTPRRLELGVQFTGVHLHKLHETPYGVGGRLFYHMTPAVALDAEVDRFPGKTRMLLGIKSGRKWDRFGMFAKVRAGRMMSFLTVDLGGVLEYSYSPRTVLRIDLGDTIIFYGPEQRRHTVHNFQPAIGLGFRFN